MQAVRELHAATEALLDAVAVHHDVNRTDLRYLEALEREGPMTAGRLAAVSHLSPAAVTEVVDRLHRAGYVTRRPSTEDRRAQVVATSAEHTDLRTAVRGPVADDAVAALGTRPPAESHRLAEDLRALGELSRVHVRRPAAR